MLHTDIQNFAFQRVCATESSLFDIKCFADALPVPYTLNNKCLAAQYGVLFWTCYCCVDLQVVGRAGVGIDNVDLQAATEVGCLVVNAPTANTVAAAEHGIALLTALARNVAPASASMKAGKLSLVFQKSHISLIFTSHYSKLFQEINKYNSS